ncbi:hypothetical protein [Photobacterium atrarenae]|uniref:Uncharacterized protein n=1 Tax=Photobacterium atrarenae TaxID=865757 RepID=A0ABY5GPB7_9GAMM|nr:hypothetical protein [Photobacterium atrarenae]UTV30976.1 hypothetical protein NNL38_24525 [Photobacterium atrarenae]
MPHSPVNDSKPPYAGAAIIGFSLSYAVTSIFSALLVVLKEISETIHHVLVVITGHHWVTHGLLDLILFVALGFVLSRKYGDADITDNALIMSITGSTILSGLIISGYYL